MEPFAALVPLYVSVPGEVAVEVVIHEVFAAAVFVHGVITPQNFVFYSGCVVLLTDALLHGLLVGIAYFCPALMGRVIRVGIGIYHGDDALEALDIDCRSHYAISFTWDSMNAISFSSRPYLA